MRALLAGALLTAVLASCGSPPGVLFNTTLSNPDGEFPLPVELGDTSGLVVGIGPAQLDPADFRDAGVLADPTTPNGFILTWLGGMCDSDAALVFSRRDSGYDIRLTAHGKPGLGGCPAAGILRGLRIETSQAIPVATITVSGSKTIQLILDEDCGPLVAAATSDSKIACLALIGATIGERSDEFASVTVAPADGACPGNECSTAAGIAAQPWRVSAMDRKGQPHVWQCTYHDESASCTEGTEPLSP